MSEKEGNELSVLLVTLFRGVLYREENGPLWQQLLRLEGQLQDYLSVLGLELNLFEDEGFAYIGNRENSEDEDPLPRLVPRRQLSYPVSLTLALLRRRLADHDARSGEERLILDTSEVIEMVRTYLPSGTNEAKTADQIESAIRKILELGFIRYLGKDSGKIEVKRIIKAFVDAQWLKEFDERLSEYAEYGERSVGE
jgi:hypothetical protein